MPRKIRMGMVGGGRGAFIGAVHRIAAAIDQQIELVCGAFSSSPEKSKASGEDLFLPSDRVYGSYEEMILKEKELPEDVRMDFISIVTPNHVHFGPAKMALENGFHVVCDKPMTFSVEEAKMLVDLVEETGLIFALTHNYTGYPMVKQARDMISAGDIGKVRKVVVEYPQGWLATKLEDSDQKQASWRTDPSKSGLGGAMGDIGTHAENLAEYMTGLQIEAVCADLTSFVPAVASTMTPTFCSALLVVPRASSTVARLPLAKKMASIFGFGGKRADWSGTNRSPIPSSLNIWTVLLPTSAPESGN
jgi:predicted dehydrogenase